MPGSTIPPNTSLYVKNIDSKIKKPELRSQLYALFGTYGRVLDVVATREPAMRGQAFLVFADLASATAAMRALHGFAFYDRALHIDYAQTRSKADVVHKLGHDALFDPKIAASMHKDGGAGPASAASKPAGARVTYSSAQGKAGKKRARDEEGSSEEDEENDAEDEAEKPATRGKKAASSAASDESGPSRNKAARTEPAPAQDEPRRKSAQAASEAEEEDMQTDYDDEETEPAAASGSAPAKADAKSEAAAPALPEAADKPNDTLYCPTLSADATDETLNELFGQHPGLVNITTDTQAHGKRNARYALVRFESTAQAEAAREALNGHKFGPRKVLNVHFAKRGA